MASDIKSKVKSLYEIMKEEKIQELEVESKDYSICIRRKNSNENKRNKQSPGVLKEQESAEKNIISYDKPKESQVLGKTIKSPITGIFYRSSAPSAPSYVCEGDIVESGKTICIIEAMKVMNEIKAPFKVKIVKTLVENGKPVSIGQDLFEVEKNINNG
jgi:acetyl-CoA carboxylase biotin carboxyl carrier protein